jgi:gas vesicle protein
MRGNEKQNRMKQWARLALKCGLVLTDAKLWSQINDHLGERVEDVNDNIRRKYDEASDRVQAAHGAMMGRTHWVAPTASFIGGIGLGLGLGILFAPASGKETRATIHDKAMGLKDKVGDLREIRFGSHSATGTD